MDAAINQNHPNAIEIRLYEGLLGTEKGRIESN